MIHPYNQSYLQDAMLNLAEAIDVACYCFHFTPDYFFFLFIASGIAMQFEHGNPKYIAGKSGTELVLDTVSRVYEDFEEPSLDLSYREPTPEYWLGWVLAYYQWETGRSFQEIQRIIPMDLLITKYHPFHEMDESVVIDFIEKRASKLETYNRLQAYRKRLGMSQRQLAEASGTNIRTLQQYEIGAKDINSASVTTVLALSKALNCNVSDLLQP